MAPYHLSIGFKQFLIAYLGLVNQYINFEI